MKTLAVTFLSAIAIICAAIICDSLTNESCDEDACLVGKTIVSRDIYGRVTNELTLAINGKEWRETSMKQVSYSDNKVETTTYDKVNGTWVPVSRLVSVSVNGVDATKTYYEADAAGHWSIAANFDEADLSNDDVVDDLVFDANGNIVMQATYVYNGDKRVGLQKEEYEYEGNSQVRRTSYSWGADQWRKDLSSKLIYQ